MATEDSFAHGTYGDDSGVVFYGPPIGGLWDDRLAVSDRYIAPLFAAILDRAQHAGGNAAPKLVTEWNEGKGWADKTGIQRIQPADASELVVALVSVSIRDVGPHVAGVTAEECLRCAHAITGFLRDRADRGQQVYIEND